MTVSREELMISILKAFIGMALFYLLGEAFVLTTESSSGYFSLGVGGVSLILFVSMIVAFFYHETINAPILVVVFFWFFYMFGLVFRPIIYEQNISSVNGYAIVLSFFIALIGAFIIKDVKIERTKIATTFPPPSALSVVLGMSLSVSLVSALVWYALKGDVPVFSEETNIVRTTNNYYPIRQLIFTSAPAFWVAICYPLYIRRYRVRMVVYFLITSFLLLSTGYRSFPLGFVLISLIIAYRRGYFGTVNLKMVLAVLSLGVVVLGYGSFRNQQTLESDDTRTNLAVTFQAFFNRPTALQDISEAFPNTEPFSGLMLYARSFGFLLPGRQQGVGSWLKEDILELNFVGGGYNPGILGEFYIIGGYPAVLSGIFLWGLLLAILVRRTSSLNPYRSVTSSMLLFFVALSISPGLSTSVVTVTYYYFILVVISIANSTLKYSGSHISDNGLSCHQR